jgi:competence protein ComEC
MLHLAPLLRVVPWLVVGILLEDAFGCCPGAWALMIALLATFLLGRWPVVQSVGIGVCTLLLGMLLMSRQQQRLAFPTNDNRQVVEAVIISEVTEKPKSMAADLLLVHNGRRIKGYLAKDKRSRQLQPGDGLLLHTRIEATDTLRLGRFDYGRYLRVNGFTGRCWVGSGDWQRKPVAQRELTATMRLKLRALCWRHQLMQRYRTLTDNEKDAYAVLTAMTLGDKTALTRNLRDVYAQTGASHVLALSGLHMGILFCLLSLFTLVDRFSIVTKLLTILLFWSFALLTGLSVSVVRSALMLSLTCISSLRGNHGISLNTLCFSAIVILMLNPYAVFDISFQLSFVAVFSILTILPIMESFLPERFLLFHRWARILWGLVAVGVAAQIGTAPLVAFHFGRLPLYFILTNLLVIPCAYAVLWLCLAYLLCPFNLLAKTILFIVTHLNATLAIMSRWPYASIDHLHPSVLQTVMVYVIIITLSLAIVRWRGLRY